MAVHTVPEPQIEHVVLVRAAPERVHDALTTAAGLDAWFTAGALFVVFHSPGSTWLPGVDFRGQPGGAGHVAHDRRWHEQGKLEMGGPFLAAGGGGMMLAAAKDTERNHAGALRDYIEQRLLD